MKIWMQGRDFSPSEWAPRLSSAHTCSIYMYGIVAIVLIPWKAFYIIVTMDTLSVEAYMHGQDDGV